MQYAGLNVDALADLIPPPANGPRQVVDWQPVLGGHSRVIGRFRLSDLGPGRYFVSRSIPPRGGAMGGVKDASAEFAVLKFLTDKTSVSVPHVIGFDIDGSKTGASTVVVDYIEGGTLLAYNRTASKDELRVASLDLAELAASIHTVGTDDLPNVLTRYEDWDTYVDACIAEWRATEATHLEPVPFVAYAADWLDRNRPQPAPLTLVHTDFSPANILRSGDGTLFAIDWEFVHIGDPREDLGWCRARGKTSPPSLIEVDEAAFLARYRERTGLGEDIVNSWTLRYFTVFAELRTLLSVYQGVAAFSRGATHVLGAGYVVGALTYAHRQWLDQLQQLEKDATRC